MRTCVREAEFSESLARLYRNEEFADEIANSVEFALGRCPDPLVYPVIKHGPRGSVMIYKSRRNGVLPPFVVLFMYQEDQIFLLDIWASLPDEPGE